MTIFYQSYVKRVGFMVLLGIGLSLGGFSVLGYARTFNIFDKTPTKPPLASQPQRYGERGATVLPRRQSPPAEVSRAEDRQAVTFLPWRPPSSSAPTDGDPGTRPADPSPPAVAHPIPYPQAVFGARDRPWPPSASPSSQAVSSEDHWTPHQEDLPESVQGSQVAAVRPIPVMAAPTAIEPWLTDPEAGADDGLLLPGDSGVSPVALRSPNQSGLDEATRSAVIVQDNGQAHTVKWTRGSTAAPDPTLLAQFKPTPTTFPGIQLAQAITGDGESSSAGGGAGGGDDRVRIDFKETDLKTVIRLIYEPLGVNFMIDDQVAGKVTILGPKDKKSVSIEEADFVLKSVLEIYGFGVQELDGIRRIIPKKTAASQNLPIRTQTPDHLSGSDPLANPEYLVVQFFRIEHVPAPEIQKVVLALTGNQGGIILYPPTNAMIVIDSELSLRRVAQIVAELDQEVPGRIVVPIRLNNTLAPIVAKKLTEVLKQRDAGKPDVKTYKSIMSQPVILADDRTNALVLVCLEEQVRELVDLVELIDTDDVYTPPYKVIHLQNADAEQVASQVGEAFKVGGESTAAFKIIPDARTQSLILTAASRTMMQRVEEMLQFLDSAAIPADGVTIHHYPMKFSDATKVKDVLSNLEESEKDGVSPVKIIADETTNSLVIISNKAKYAEIQSVLNNLDTLRPQVMVEVLIVDVSLDRRKNIGADLNIIPIDDDRADAFFLGSTGAIQSGLLGGPSAGAHIGFLAGGQFDASTLTSTSPDLNELSKITYLVNLFKADNRANILQAPRIVSADNVTSKINVGERVQVPTGISLVQQPGQIPFTNFSTEELGLSLEITPRITKNDFITLKINVEIKNRTGDVLNFGQFQTPVFTETGVETEVTVKNNTTLVIGGLIREDKQKQVSKIPLLGDIPVFGRLFQNRSTQTIKRDLMIFMTPRVIRDAYAAQQITRREETVLNYRDMPSHTLPHSLGIPITAQTISTDLLKGKIKGP